MSAAAHPARSREGMILRFLPDIVWAPEPDCPVLLQVPRKFASYLFCQNSQTLGLSSPVPRWLGTQISTTSPGQAPHGLAKAAREAPSRGKFQALQKSSWPSCKALHAVASCQPSLSCSTHISYTESPWSCPWVPVGGSNGRALGRVKQGAGDRGSDTADGGLVEAALY